ncbi:phosphoglycolate phosphatase [Erwinia tracheiphila]|uniref:Phosphoglycolate phosphatase n=1 Tax=Erwinia tracheiphila TaxID=65700 RepID=A0A0M2KIN2_9GAMM|nr:phosphoglycolate phosphatase [Erwinia tracheiphila]AXF78036.1 phosphoglycolate phosphatase [Erwinia tracheiphila]EOS95487.1 phosphoglycolate phosphatase [Erwinia tracheiphila PSU-1]KKF37172.1 phosphoglycolate phosphatase [Erwinia tracheiphila]UIA83250.1 phosphoglycolate phosphatase [Erwinia tracheiphila]UIA88561.1 phosphoglycolate phosphatase [Erwinia tracheiphila]
MAHFTEIRGVAFDLDGTLVDSAPGLADAIDATLTTLHLPAAGVARVSTWIGNGADIMIERALNWALGHKPTGDLHAEACTLFDKHYAVTVKTGSRLFPAVKENLAAMAASGIPMAIVTNKPTAFIQPLLISSGISDYFSLVLGGDDVVMKKPHPAPIFLVLGTFGLLPAELLFVGDSRNDILAAQAAGCPCTGMTYGYNYGEPVASSHPNLVLDHFNDLLPAIGLSSPGYHS